MANCKEYQNFLIILKNINLQKQEIKGRKSKEYKKGKKKITQNRQKANNINNALGNAKNAKENQEKRQNSIHENGKKAKKTFAMILVSF